MLAAFKKEPRRRQCRRRVGLVLGLMKLKIDCLGPCLSTVRPYFAADLRTGLGTEIETGGGISTPVSGEEVIVDIYLSM